MIWFLVAIALGLAGGLIYGWVLNPGSSDQTSPDTLRVDFKTDAVLMVAEIYQQESDPAAAAARLAQLSGDLPVRLVQQAILNGQELGYPRSDIETLARLFQALQNYTPAPEETQP